MLDKNGVEIRVGDTLKHVVSTYQVLVASIKNGICWPERENEDPGALDTDKYWEVIRRADGSDPRTGPETAERFLEEYNKLLGENHHLLAGCFCNIFDCPHKREADRVKQAAKSPSELYADFHRIVTETVAREAPKVKVVTDFQFNKCMAFFSFQEFVGDIDWWLHDSPGDIENRVKAVLYCFAEGIAEKVLR